MRVGLAQVNTRVGDLAGNAETIIEAARAADGADVVVFPELCLPGPPPRDLLLDPGFVREVLAATGQVIDALVDGPPVIFGALQRATATPGLPGLHNTALTVQGGRVLGRTYKRLLPTYDVFHEARWFTPGTSCEPVEVDDELLGVLVCEDLWSEGYPRDPAAELREAGADVLVCLAASPYRAGIGDKRLEVARRAGGPLVYVNAVGGNDELVFDGRSFVLDPDGEVLAQLPAFEEAVEVVDLEGPRRYRPPMSDVQLTYRALVTGVRDFCWKNGVRDAWLGLSGGVDSALVACIAADALGPEHVHALALPTRFNDPRSTRSARELALRLGIHFAVFELDGLRLALERELAGLLDGGGTTGENLQARARTLVLMAHCNRHGGILLNTSNKTELALGYGTLYADLAGTLSVLGDVPKPLVYELSRYAGRIPAFILERPPSAELRDDQVDPFDYDRVSPLVEALATGAAVPPGFDPDEVASFRRKVRAAEYKRWQSGVVLKVSRKAFGTGRLVPVTRG